MRPGGRAPATASGRTVSSGSTSVFSRAGHHLASVWRMPFSTSRRTCGARRQPLRSSRTRASPGARPPPGCSHGCGRERDSRGGASCSACSPTSPRASSRCSSTATSCGWSGDTDCRPGDVNVACALAAARSTGTWTTKTSVSWWSSTAGSGTSSRRTGGTTWIATSRVSRRATSPCARVGDRCWNHVASPVPWAECWWLVVGPGTWCRAARTVAPSWFVVLFRPHEPANVHEPRSGRALRGCGRRRPRARGCGGTPRRASSAHSRAPRPGPRPAARCASASTRAAPAPTAACGARAGPG